MGPALDAWQGNEWTVAADWRDLVTAFLASSQGQELASRLRARLAQGAIIYPPEPLRMLRLTPLSGVKVVIVGQDPYHGPGQAEGLAFSVSPGVRPPPSLRNIFKELVRDLGGTMPRHGSLGAWSSQGVLLLNTCLTVEDGCAASHARFGWEALTSNVLTACNAQPHGVAFLLWGAHAQAFRPLIDESRHLVLTANHPSPLSALRPPAPFIGCGHFSRVNQWLADNGRSVINWFAN
jgi:uracil-DNA glycosylase